MGCGNLADIVSYGIIPVGICCDRITLRFDWSHLYFLTSNSLWNGVAFGQLDLYGNKTDLQSIVHVDY